MATVMFDVGNDPLPSGGWPVLRNGVQIGAFASKTAAIAWTAQEAARLHERAVITLIHIEGADGVWRVFDASMKAPLT